MKNEIKLEIIELVKENIDMDPEVTCEAVCLHIGGLIEKTVLPAYSKIVDAYWEAFPTGDHAIVLDHNVPIGNAVYKLNDEYSIKAYRRMSHVADKIKDYSETLEAVIQEYKNIDPEHPTIPYLSQALSIQDNTAQFLEDAEAIMLDTANIK